MKKIITFSILALSLVLSSCEKYLDKEPHNYQVIENFYQTPRDIESAVTGCYNALVTIKRSSELLFNENRSDNGTYPHTDNITSNTEAYYPSILSVEATNDYVTAYWSNSYDLITRTNLVLKHIDVVSDPVLKAQYLAQAKFLRAWSYFNLVRYFGGVPLITKPILSDEAVNIPRSEQAAVYAQIVADLQDSYTQFNLTVGKYTSKYGQVNKWSANALLGKVFLAMGKPQDALAPLEDVYKNSPYTLTANYADLFVAANETTQANKEVLFPIRYTSGGLNLGNNFSTLAGATQVSKFGTNLTYYSNGLQNAFINKSDITKDTRYPVICGDIANNFTPGPTVTADKILKRYIPKLVGLVSDGVGGYKADQLIIANDGPLDWPELRFADVVLMYAEVKGLAGGGLDILNRVRTRAKAPLLTTATLATLFNNDFQEAVLNERRLELAFENDRWFDLKRMGNTYMAAALGVKYSTEPAYNKYYPQTNILVAQVLNGGSIDPFRFLLPIPYNQILLSKAIVQNPGYFN